MLLKPKFERALVKILTLLCTIAVAVYLVRGLTDAYYFMATRQAANARILELTEEDPAATMSHLLRFSYFNRNESQDIECEMYVDERQAAKIEMEADAASFKIYYTTRSPYDFYLPGYHNPTVLRIIVQNIFLLLSAILVIRLFAERDGPPV